MNPYAGSFLLNSWCINSFWFFISLSVYCWWLFQTVVPCYSIACIYFYSFTSILVETFLSYINTGFQISIKLNYCPGWNLRASLRVIFGISTNNINSFVLCLPPPHSSLFHLCVLQLHHSFQLPLYFYQPVSVALEQQENKNFFKRQWCCSYIKPHRVPARSRVSHWTKQ